MIEVSLFSESAGENCSQWQRIALLGVTAVAAALSCIEAPEYAYEGGALWLHHIGTFLLLVAMVADLKTRTLSFRGSLCLSLFALLHILGARYLYSNVPYDEWLQPFGIGGIDPESIHPNQYDRLVHFCFGLLMLPVFRQLAERRLKKSNFALSLACAWLLVQCCSMLYEIFEWYLSEVMNPEDAEVYNGQQGDMWDAQKDMALALLGATVAVPILAGLRWLRAKFRRRRRFIDF